MKKRVHAAAGIAGFVIILIFSPATVVSELFGSHQAIAAAKDSILWGMTLLVPFLAIAGASGMWMGRQRQDQPILRKKKRMPFIALNGLIILVPSAFFLAVRVGAGQFDGWFYSIQSVELLAGAANLCLMGFNIRDGLLATGRLIERPARPASS